ncbi:signal peptidase II [Adlercreutzia agrestimuris]|uniref:signal peptidase II n=1 Tax=Adlercreutzia agrestimuris TaxID=2941324 RepID=UPI0020401759|nr:signal peptidase II [Adlercreutzia agrestimuris]
MQSSHEPRFNNRKKIGIVFSAIVLAWLVFDLITKAYFNSFELGSVIAGPFAGIFRFRLVHNTGMAWGLFGDSTIALGIMSLVVCAALTIYLFANIRYINWFQVIGIGLVVSGGLGNAIDRFFQGYVIDFIETTFINFPVFNIADIGVTCGFVIFLVGLFVSFGKDSQNLEAPADENREDHLSQER